MTSAGSIQTQLDFDAADRAAIESSRPLTRREQFEKFNDENPHVYDAIKNRALHFRKLGCDWWSIEEIYNHLRCIQQLKTAGDPEFRLNNNYKAFYVRKLMDEVDELKGMFELREPTARKAK